MSVTRRWAGFAATAAAIALITAGCGGNNNNSTGAQSSAAQPTVSTSASSGESGSATPTESGSASATESGSASATESGTAGASGTATPGAAAGSTKIATPAGDIEVSGDILSKYNELGGPTGTLGLPTGAAKTIGGDGHYQEFAGGAIFYSQGTGAHVVWGDIRTAYDQNGGPGGELGFPTSDETDIPGGKQSTFQHGKITWNASDRKTEVVKS
ncbi:hypothetical protein FOS14_00915 [Skermania sp. ID1734]|uniref:LGFP repeat-containing protein n=1 Tax=Skermania sp. ID1734 TaxID=2597516 RepID=UPI001180470D|nr:hypothetical protein [Skermania sp. ID1734]TSE02220.1 hypothetical protein FOS14_00915 [Skermania sp. ID1734]